MSAPLGLIRYDAMCTAIAVCCSVDEVKDLRDKAKALEVYAQQARNVEAERKCCEVRIRAERRAGELLRDMAATGQRLKPGDAGRSKANISPKSSGTTLVDLGITRDQSSKWQQLANVPEEEFERAVNGDGPKPTTEGIINANTLRENPMPKVDMDALWLWGHLKDFERSGIFDRDLSELFVTMTNPMRQDCRRLLPMALTLLVELKEVACDGRAA